MASSPSIAIVGMACVYPDARTPGELWENVLAQRRAFRTLPDERFRLQDYWSADRSKPDSSYSAQGAVIEGYEFDRVAFRVVGSTYRAADLAHWLALDVASRALGDAGFVDGRGLPRESTGVLVGNTLTGEFSRAGLMRLRWPYVRRKVEAALTQEGWPEQQRAVFLQKLETEYKEPFAPVGEESLAGGLSNTIAGRICNHFDLKGGGYTVDGACASSLLATANACSALAAGDLDAALAGGVDLSLDPFELVGFAKTGALAVDEMRVFDRDSAGFWPGEGCGFVVLMRHEDALAQGCRVYAVIRGWGISSDGKGGITRPEAAGQLEAIRRAYRRAKFGPETVMYCEAHGTGTSVGDATELEVLSKARRPEIPVPIPWGERQGDSQRGERQRAAIGSIKANIGHTKAAAGLASLIKATMAVHTQVLPPTTGCEHPVASCGESNSPLRVLREAEVWPEHEPLRASVSAMGFGGINAHLVLESTAGERRHALSTRERALSSTSQDAELFLFAGSDLEHLRLQVIRALLWAGRISRSELTDAAAQLQAELQPLKTRASVVASTPAELFERLQKLSKLLEKQPAAKPVFADGIFFRLAQKNPRLAFLFPGQGSPTYLDGGLWARRFDSVRKLYAVAALRSENDEDAASTRIAQPAIVTASLAGLKVLEKFGIRADVALGHSLGEITALQWAGVLSEEALLRIARVRGAAMAELGTPTGTMLAIAAPAETVQPLIKGQRAWVVGLNSPQQTVIGGESVAIERVARIAKRAGWHTTPLQVSHAFHTPLVAAARPLLEEQLAQEDFVRPNAQVISTVTGKALSGRDSLPELLSRQITSPVRFTDALAALLSEGIDLCIEVGPGSVLSGLVRESSDVPVIALDSAGSSVRGLLQAFGAAFALGMPVRAEALFADRFVRPFNLDWKPKFFANPCEAGVITNEQSALSVPLAPSDVQRASLPSEVNLRKEAVTGQSQGSHTSYTPLQVLRQLVSDRAELPLSAVTNESRMLADLHLNSITVSQLVSEAARRLQLPRITSLLDFANARIGEIAQALEDLRQTGKRPDAEKPQLPAGAGAWVEAFNTELVPAPLNRTGPTSKAVSGQSSWQFFSSPGNRLSAPLREKLETSNRSGVVVCLPEPADENSISLLLDAARAAPNLKPGGLFLLVQHGWGGSGFAKTLHLETGITTCVVNVPPDHPKAVDLLTNEAASASRFVEAFYDRDGHRSEPRLVPMETAEGSSSAPRFPVTKRDVLLVTGGGKGIAAECALALGRDSGAALALLGRSDPKTDPELAANLKRIQAAGVSCCYVQADVTDEPAVRRAIKTAERKLGPITGVLHGAGLNTPRLISSLDADTFRQTLAPKVNGLRNVLSAVDSKRLRLLVTFSSIIARAGLPGEADYATANEWLSAMTKDFQNEHPRCRCLAVEWSVWAGVGMGERLGRVEALLQQGITPIPTDEGVAKLLQLLKSPPSQTAVVVSGRFGEPPTLKVKEAELPLHRFLERKLVHYPGIELVVDAELSLQNDPYLNDHVVQGERLFPAVLGLEAMAQAAMALCGQSAPSFEQVNLARPITIDQTRPTTIRLAAIRRGPHQVEVCLRSDETDFQVDHFRALCCFSGLKSPTTHGQNPASTRQVAARPSLRLDPSNDLYGRILFHQGRFCRVSGYRTLKARECFAEITTDGRTKWFGPYRPEGFVLGDPGARDAALHAIQACIPHQRILPAAIGRVEILDTTPGIHFVAARETSRNGSTFIYNLEIMNQQGRVVERWSELTLRAIEPMSARASWPAALAVPYFERRLEELLPERLVSVAMEHNGRGRKAAVRLRSETEQSETTFFFAAGRTASSNSAMKAALGRPARIWRRPDGKPVMWAARQPWPAGQLRAAGAGSGGRTVSAAHQDALTLAIASQGQVACDLEAVVARPEPVWHQLLGNKHCSLAARISRERSESIDSASTRIWTVLECLKKAGLPVGAPLVLESAADDGWLVLRSGTIGIASCILAVQGMKNDMAIAFALSDMPVAAC